ncbi:MAG: hypothetical protein MUE74_12520 [Bacteroidales bacterium]|jgi:uncharacterized protein (TIGR02145 family)|nr:hypothetical protein [Bacteroidales bacterium]
MKKHNLPVQGYSLFILASALFLGTSCKKETPVVLTLAVTNITHESAVSGGNVTDEGDGSVVSRGIVWGENDPTLESNDGFMSMGNGAGMFSCDITNLKPYTEYTVKSFASSEYGTSYGNSQSFRTLANLASVETVTPFEISSEGAKTGGTISDEGGVEITQRGIYYGISNNPEVSGTKVSSGSGSGTFTVTLTELLPGTKYYVRAFAVNMKGESLGSLVNFTTLTSAPKVSTTDPYDITGISAKSGGTITSEGGLTITDKGIYWGTAPDPHQNGIKIQAGSGPAPFTVNLNNLSPGVRYYITAYATNTAGTGFGDPKTFDTPRTIPEVITTAASGITGETSVVGGTVVSDGGYNVTERGIYWGISANPEINGTKLPVGSGTGSFSTTLTGLSQNTIYYVTAYAINQLGEDLGSMLTFVTKHTSLTGDIIYNPSLTYGSVTDIEGNSYKTIVIGNQTWMADNLRTTKFNNGNPIKNVTGNSAWVSLETPAYSWYNNDISYKDIIGALYNWYVLDSGNICPQGWHIPTDNEWTILADYLGGSTVAGAKVKEVGTTHWDEPNTGATNSSGFTSLPSGHRSDNDGSFSGLFIFETMWSSTEYNELKPFYRTTSSTNTELWRGYGGYKKIGKSMRCIKD